MRRPVYAATFVEDADKIAHYIETRFGITYADAFIASLNRFGEIVASQPGLGKQNHGLRRDALRRRARRELDSLSVRR